MNEKQGKKTIQLHIEMLKLNKTQFANQMGISRRSLYYAISSERPLSESTWEKFLSWKTRNKIGL
jgi:transcriptional antiterminator